MPGGAFRPTGVTLIELVVALGVLSLAVGAIFGIVGVANRSAFLTRQFHDLQYNARVAVERINEEVRWGGVPAPGAGGFIETETSSVAVTVPQDPEYPVCARPCRPYPEAEPGRAYAVRFFFDRKSATVRRQVDAIGRFDDGGWVPGEWAPRDGVVIANHVSEIAFEYFDQNGIQTDSPQSAYRLRMRIEVRLGRHFRSLTSDAFLRQK